jgi:hypothetical protein
MTHGKQEYTERERLLIRCVFTEGHDGEAIAECVKRLTHDDAQGDSPMTMTHAASLTEDPKCAITPEEARHETIAALMRHLHDAGELANALQWRHGDDMEHDAADALYHAICRAQEALRDYDAVSA